MSELSYKDEAASANDQAFAHVFDAFPPVPAADGPS